MCVWNRESVWARERKGVWEGDGHVIKAAVHWTTNRGILKPRISNASLFSLFLSKVSLRNTWIHSHGKKPSLGKDHLLLFEFRRGCFVTGKNRDASVIKFCWIVFKSSTWQRLCQTALCISESFFCALPVFSLSLSYSLFVVFSVWTPFPVFARAWFLLVGITIPFTLESSSWLIKVQGKNDLFMILISTVLGTTFMPD